MITEGIFRAAPKPGLGGASASPALREPRAGAFVPSLPSQN